MIYESLKGEAECAGYDNYSDKFFAICVWDMCVTEADKVV
jgi:hypothetical protein